MKDKKWFTSSNIWNQNTKNSFSSKNSSHLLLKCLLFFVWVVIVFVFSVSTISWVRHVYQKVRKNIVSVVSKTVWTPMIRDQYNSINVLLLWYWWDTHQGWYLTDSIMVASWNPDQNNVSLFSLPRDLYVKSPVNWSYWRINAIFQQYYSRTKSIEESAMWFADKLEEILWLNIPYYMTIDFQAFKEIVDALWWVDVYVTSSIYDPTYPADNMRDYSPFYIDAGWQHLDWATALKYARSRHSTSDFARSLRQQELIIAIKDKMLWSWLNVSIMTELYNQYMNYIQTNIWLQEMLWTVQYLPEIKGFSSFWYTSQCWDASVSSMKPWCFLYTPRMSDFWWMSVVLPDWATSSNVSYYKQMKSFITFILTHRKFLTENASVEVVNSVWKNVLISNWLWRVPVATRFGAKLVKYWLNVTNSTNWDEVENSYIQVNMVWDFSWTIEAIQTFFPILDVRVDTWSVQVEYDDEGNVKEYWTDRAYVTVVLWNDYILWNDHTLWLKDNKFSYVLDIDPLPPLNIKQNKDDEDVNIQ